LASLLKEKHTSGHLKVLIHYQLVRGGQVVMADAFMRPKKNCSFLFKVPKIAQKCND